MQFTKNYSPTKSDLAFEEFRKNFNYPLEEMFVLDNDMLIGLTRSRKLNEEIKNCSLDIIKSLCLPLTIGKITETLLSGNWMNVTYHEKENVPEKIFSLNNIYSPAKVIL